MNIEQIIMPREVPIIGGMSVRRILPFRARRMVGPFAFLDEMGPVSLAPGKVGDVPVHPHIGLSTVTYLFEGELMHRDSLGTRQKIVPGDVNWMMAGGGIAHSERVPAELREKRANLHGLQAWVALPKESEETSPAFDHYSAKSLPEFEIGGVKIHLLAGSAYSCSSPVKTHSTLFYFTTKFESGQSLEFDPGKQESAFYLISGDIEIDEQELKAPLLVVFKPGAKSKIIARSRALGAYLGGERLEGERHIFWNFVSSSLGRIEKAKDDWRAQRFPKVPDETEWVPL